MASNQHIIRTQDYAQDHIPDAVLDANDPVYEIKALAGLGNLAKLQQYTLSQPSDEGSNCSITANEKIQYQKKHDVRPGTPEWFKLWFSKPYMTGEKPW